MAASAARDAGTGPRRRVLAIDDDTDMCWVLKSVLEGLGCVVTVAHCGRQALELLGGNSFDAVFVDLRLPDIEGIQLAEVIRSSQPRARITAISGYYSEDDPQIAEAIRAMTISGFLAKPFDIETVIAAAT